MWSNDGGEQWLHQVVSLHKTVSTAVLLCINLKSLRFGLQTQHVQLLLSQLDVIITLQMTHLGVN